MKISQWIYDQLPLEFKDLPDSLLVKTHLFSKVAILDICNTDVLVWTKDNEVVRKDKVFLLTTDRQLRKKYNGLNKYIDEFRKKYFKEQKKNTEPTFRIPEPLIESIRNHCWEQQAALECLNDSNLPCEDIDENVDEDIYEDEHTPYIMHPDGRMEVIEEFNF